MKYFMILITVLLLGGCVKTTYNSRDGVEEFTLTSFFKSVDGLKSTKNAQGFGIEIDKTHTKDPTSNMLEMMRMMYGFPPPIMPLPAENQ